MKTCLYNFDPLKPHFYIVKLGFTGVNIILLISAQKRSGYSLEPPRWGGSNEYPQSMFWAEIWKISELFYLKIFSFLEVKFTIYLNRRVFVMINMYINKDTCGSGFISFTKYLLFYNMLTILYNGYPNILP